jgi:tetratricopeptide (TPR) repeat protein
VSSAPQRKRNKKWIIAALVAAILFLGEVAVEVLSETRKAIEFYEQALTVLRELGDKRGEGSVLGNLGLAYAALGETRKAIGFYERRIEIAREIGDRRGEGNALWNMSTTMDKLGERAKAIECAEAALKIYEEIESPYAERVRKKQAEWKGRAQE